MVSILPAKFFAGAFLTGLAHAAGTAENKKSIDKKRCRAYNVSWLTISGLTFKGGIMGREDHIGFHLRTADVLAKRFRDSLSEINPAERLTGVQGWVVGYLYEHREADVFQRDLEAVFSVRRSTMTNMLQLMEKNGYITRESVSHDARLKKLCSRPKPFLRMSM